MAQDFDADALGVGQDVKFLHANPRGRHPGVAQTEGGDALGQGFHKVNMTGSGKGAHALYIDNDRIRIMTVADTRGDRPWSRRTRPDPALPFDGADEDGPARGQRSR